MGFQGDVTYKKKSGSKKEVKLLLFYVTQIKLEKKNLALLLSHDTCYVNNDIHITSI